MTEHKIYRLEKDNDGGWWIIEGGFSLAFCRKLEDAERVMKALKKEVSHV